MVRLSAATSVPKVDNCRTLGGMTDVRHREQQDEKVLAKATAGPSIDDAQAQALLDKHMSRWSTLLDRLK